MEKNLILAWFDGLRIHSRLHFITFVLFTAILALGAAYFYVDRAITPSLNRQNQLTKFSQQIYLAEISYLQMKNAGINFIAHRNPKYIGEFSNASVRAEKALRHSTRYINDAYFLNRIKQLRVEIGRHKNGFSEIYRLYLLLGLNENTGIQGKLRLAVHQIENKLETTVEEEMTNKLLMMRRHEKDYILRGSSKYITQHDERVSEFHLLLDASEITQSDQTELTRLLKTYQKEFHYFTKISILRDQKVETLGNIYNDIKPEFLEISEAATRLENKAETVVMAARANTNEILMISVTLVILISTGLAHIIGKGIATPIIRQTDALEKLAHGDTSVEISDLQLKNEIGVLARTMQVFKDNAIEHMWVMDSQEQLEKIAYYDALTGLANRAHCQKDLAESFTFVDENKKFALIQIDLDNFKRVNDTLGHATGDILLHTLGRRLDFLADELGNFKPYRWGGDEFVVLVQRDDDTDLEGICQELTDLIAIPIQAEGTTLRPTVSLGVARYPEDAPDISSLMIYSDLALYKTKELGRDGYQFFSSDMKEKIDSENRIEQELRVALDERQLLLYFQPQIDITDGAIVGIEALVRWNHPEHGVLTPVSFLDVAEKNGLAQTMGRLIFDEAMKAISHWKEAGLDFGKLAINLSPEHLKKRSFLEDLFGSMDKYGVAPNHLAVEFLESFLLDDANANIENLLVELGARGIHVELDDFGTGYASLSHLSSMPINGLKIDRSFVTHMLDNKRQEGIVRALITMAKLMDLRIVCEGIETREQLDMLSQIGTCSVQGYFISKPMPFEEMTDWIRSNQNMNILNLPKDAKAGAA